MNNPNDPAYPTGRQEVVFQYEPATSMPKPQTFIVPQGGMTIRQRFVMAAMEGMVSSAEDFGGMASFANAAVKLADAALAEEASRRVAMTGFTEELVLERSALKQDNAALRALLAECRRHVVDNHEVAVNEDDRLAEGECNALLDRIDAAVQEVKA